MSTRAEMQVNEINAASFSDNYAIIGAETGNLLGCEHNKQEADAISAWKNRDYYCARTEVVHNTPDQVRAARDFLKGRVVRFEHRDEALRVMGVTA